MFTWSIGVVGVVALSIGCGEVSKLPPDGGGDDAGPEIDASLAPVTVTVLTTLGDGAPDPTARVVFQDPDGALVADREVDAMGRAQAMLPLGGTVSAIRTLTDTPTELTAAVTTTRGVKPGDDLTFGLKQNATITNQGGQTTMTASFPLVSGATTYSLFTPCGATRAAASPATLGFRDSCRRATFDLLATTVGGTPAVPMFTKVTDVTYQSGDTFAIPVAFSPMPSFSINMINVPAAVSSMAVVRASMLGNLPVASTTIAMASDPAAGSVSVGVPYAPNFGTRSELAVILGRSDTLIPQRHDVHTATLGTSATVDLGKLQLPWFTSLAPTTTGATWTQVAAGDPPDGMLTKWSGHWMDGARLVSVTWQVAQPAELAGMTLPRLPATYARLDPGQQTAAVIPTSMTLYMDDYDNVTGYDGIRPMPETLLTLPIGTMGAFVGMPFQRRHIAITVDAP